MHYVPESSREFLPQDPAGVGKTKRGVHYQSAPLYLLTLATALLVIADLLAQATGAIPSVGLGYRWALLAAILGGSRILYLTLEDVSSGRIGAGIALCIAFIAAVWLGETMTAALVVLITLTGECVERYTIDKAHAAIRSVFDLYPPTARIVENGSERECSPSELNPGDLVVVRPGERIPADGSIVDGATTIDQSALTGESGPLEKSTGDDVFAGTVNQFGAVTICVNQPAQESVLGQVTQTVAEASRRKSASERTADRLAKEFLPIVLAAAAATFFGWWLASGDSSAGWRPALGVLVVACPCALVLATPTAVMAALAWLARAGIVVKGSDALERLAKVDTFAFDKTGTLTRGEMRIGSVHVFSEEVESKLQPEQLLYLISMAEQLSEHPLAEPFAKQAGDKNWTLPPIAEFSATAGGGVSARIHWEEFRKAWSNTVETAFPLKRENGEFLTLRVGNERWLESSGIRSFSDWERIIDPSTAETGLFLAIDEALCGYAGLTDTLREETRPALMELKQTGIKHLVMLTGDNERAAECVAGEIGVIDQCQAELFPAEKIRWVEEQRRSGKRVAMVGDGVNDAPALAAADVGIAVARGPHNLAAEAGEIVLLSPNLGSLPGLLRLSRAMVQNIRQSILWFAFGLNGLGMLLCGIGILSPVEGAIFHEVGSLAVMLNALRLLWFEQSREKSPSRIAERFQNAAEWITNAFSPSRWVYRVIDRWNILLRLAIAGVVAWWLMSNVLFLAHDERALVTRFGKVEAELEAGWHWRWPAPFERVYREKPNRLRTLEFGFRREGERSKVPQAIDWTSRHEETGIFPVPEESLLLTGDEVPIELTAEVHYRISDLKEYLFGNAAPPETLRSLTAQSLRSIAAQTSLDEMLTVGRKNLETNCLQQVRQRAAGLGLGVEIAQIHIVEIHPPRGVVPSYRDVANAIEEKEQQINQARADSTARLLSVAGPRAFAKLRLKNRLAVDATEDDPDRLSDDEWQELSAIDKESDEPKFHYLAGETADVLLKSRGEASSISQSARGEADRFEELRSIYREAPEFTTAELYWKTIETVLKETPFTILDPKAVGNPHLYLKNADWPEFPPVVPKTNPPADGNTN